MDNQQSTVAVPLSLEQRADIGDKLARLVERIKGVKAEAKSKAFAYREEVERLQEEQEKLSGQMILGVEEKRQMDLFVGQDEARGALAEVAKRSCTCEGGPEADVKSPTCQIHGVDGESARLAAAERAEEAADEATAEAIAEAERNRETPIGETIDGGGEAV